MKAAINTLGHVLYAPSQYVIPVFQRNYRWERPQWDKLWASLMEIRQPDKTGNHFMGFLVFVQGGVAQPGQNTRFHLIDGQQRLTTTSLLLAAIRNVANRRGDDELAQEIHTYYLVHPLKKGEHHHRLLPKAQDHAAFVAIVQRKAPPIGRMADALTYFESQLDALAASEPESLRHVFDLVCQRLEFMCATLESENAYSIFKSLNSTGVPLGQADLIRNFVFMHVHPDAQDEFDREHWAPLEARFPGPTGRLDEEAFSRFFRDVLMMDGRYVQPKDTFSTFESRHEATGFAPATLANALLASAHDYEVISGRANDTDATVTEALQGLNLLESSTTYPLVLALFRRRAEGRIDSVQLAHCIEMLRGFILRRFVCGDSSRGYGEMFSRALPAGAEETVSTLETYLLKRGWPDDRRFMDAFVTFPLYKRGYAREVLETLERARGHKEPAALRAAQIEHLMPQTLRQEWVMLLGEDAESIHADWLHRPGNLTLSAYNQELGNQPFEQKRARLAQSNIGMTRELGDAATWGADAIRVRGEAMASAAATIWAGPKEPFPGQDDEDSDDAEGTPARHEIRRKFWNGLVAHMATAHPEVPAFESRQFKTIRLRSGVTHIGVELRHQLRPSEVAIDVYFWRDAVFPVWEKLNESKGDIDRLIGDAWTFERSAKDDQPRWMSVTLAAASDDESEWRALFGWLGQKLAHVYSLILPHLRAEIEELAPTSGDDDDEDDTGDDPRNTPIKLQQQRFWGVLAEAILTRSTTLRPQKPLRQHWTNYAIGRAGFSITPTVNSREDRIGVELVIGTPNAKEHFQSLLAQRAAIEEGLGFAVEWQELPDRVMSRIGCWRDQSPPEDETRWPEYVEWLAGRILKMEEVFRPAIRTLP